MLDLKIVQNTYRVLQNPFSFITWFIVFLLSTFSWYWFSDIHYVAANYKSYTYAYFDSALSFGVVLFFPLLLAAIVYRSFLFGFSPTAKEPRWFLGIIGGITGIFISGASCCGVTLISLLGLTSVIGFLEIFPYDGLEIKILWLILLLYAYFDIYAHIDNCKIKKIKKLS